MSSPLSALALKFNYVAPPVATKGKITHPRKNSRPEPVSTPMQRNALRPSASSFAASVPSE